MVNICLVLLCLCCSCVESGHTGGRIVEINKNESE